MGLQGFDGPEDAGLDGSHGDAEGNGDLGIRHAVVAGEDQGLALFLGEARQGPAHGVPLLSVDQALFASLALGGRFRQALERNDDGAAVSPAAVAAGIGGDGKEPGRDLRPAVVLMGSRDDFDEHFLGDLLRRGPVGQQPVGEPEQGRGVFLEQLSGRGGVSALDPVEKAPVVDQPAGHCPFLPIGTTTGETSFSGKGFAVPIPVYLKGLTHKVVDFAIQLTVILFAISFHESAHAWSALQFGDTTARDLGRISLNPLRHIDLFGSIILPIILYVVSGFIFGAAKPTPVDLRNTKDPRLANLVVSAAGPLSNFLLALVGILLLRIIRAGNPGALMELLQALQGERFGAGALAPITYLLFYFVLVNAMLGVFNLIPIPPLDGSGVLASVGGPPVQRLLATIAPFGFLILIMLLSTRILNGIFRPVQNLIVRSIFG